MAGAKSNERPAADWYSKAELCRFHGIAQQTFDKAYRGIIPPAGVKKIGIRAWYHGPTYLEAVIAKRASAPPAVPNDPLLSGVDSPNLEEYRKHKARIAKVEADEREGMVVQVGRIEPQLRDAMALVRKAAENLERIYGRDAAQTVIEAIDDALLAVEKAFENAGSSRDVVAAAGVAGSETAPIADDAGVRGS